MDTGVHTAAGIVARNIVVGVARACIAAEVGVKVLAVSGGGVIARVGENDLSRLRTGP